MTAEPRRIERLAPLLACVVFLVLSLAMSIAWEATGRQVTDLGLYRSYGEQILDGRSPYGDLGFEYPPGALPPLVLPALVTSSKVAYALAFGLLLGAIGCIGILLAARARTALGAPGAETYAVLLALALSPLVLGSLLLARFDLLPAALTAGVVLALLRDRYRTAAVVLGVAIAVKLYPAVLLPLAVAWAWRRRSRLEGILAGVLAVGVAALVYLPFAIASPDGVATSIGRQLGRPLQIESLGSGLLLALHQAVGFGLGWESSHGSQNLTGTAAAVLAVALSILQLVVLAWLWARFAGGDATGERLVLHSAAVVVAFVALGKVLSPQFLIWPLFLVPLATGRRLRVAGALYAVACGLTVVWFPLRYWSVVKEFDAIGSWAIFGRDLALVGLLVALAWPITARARERAPARSPSRVPSADRT